MENNLNKLIIPEARKLIGTPFTHQGRNPSVGLDCIGFVLAVLKNIGVDLSDKDELGYSRIPSTFLLQEKFQASLFSIEKDQMQEGDIFLMRFGKFPQHTGFITQYDSNNFGVIHCYQQVGKITEHLLNDSWRSKIINIYRIKN